MITDPIADMLTRVRNAQAVGKTEVSMPLSRTKKNIAEVLEREGYIRGFSIEQDGPKGNLVLQLKYFEGKPVIVQLQRVSTPGLRKYSKTDNLPLVCDGLGIAILTTSKGIMTEKRARELGVGGEVLCYVA